jgi:hypothetical protein
MIDAPGLFTGPNADFGIGGSQHVYLYQNFEVHVSFRGDQASHLFFWHSVVKMDRGPNNTWVEQGPRNFGTGSTAMPSNDCFFRP